MDGLDLRDQLVPDGATGETEHRNGFPSAGVDLVSSHLGERRDGCLDGLSGIRGVDVGLAGLAAKPAQRGVTLGIGGLDALAFSRRSFRYFFNFGSKILITRVLHTLYMNGSYLLVGKFYSPALTGLYSQAVQMTSLLPNSIDETLSRVAYPIECELQNDNEALRHTFYRFVRLNAFIVFPLMTGLAALAEPLVRLLLMEKWLDVVPLIQILCFGWIWQPLSGLNWQILNVKHRSDYYMKSEIFKKIIAFTILFSTLFMGLVVLCVGWVIYCIIDLYVITLYTRRLLPAITFKNEMRVLVPILLRALSMGGVVYLLNYAVDSDILRIALGVPLGCVLYTGISLLTRSEEIHYLIDMIKKRK